MHVLEDQQIRSIAMPFLRPLGLEIDSLTKWLVQITENVNGKYYKKDLERPELTTARNILIEIMMRAKNN